MTNTGTKISFVILFFVFTTFIFPQQTAEIDTLRAFSNYIPDDILLYQFQNHEFDIAPNKFLFDLNQSKDSASVWIRTRMMIGSFSNPDEPFNNPAAQMTKPMLNNYLESQKFATFRKIIGSFQVGAAAYLAYRHLKKFGFLKK